MAEVSGNTLVMAIQAVDAEIRRLRSLPTEQLALDDMVLLEAYETTADELATAYRSAARTQLNLPPYAQLVGHK